MTTGNKVRISTARNRLDNDIRDLRSPGLFAKWPVVGLTMVILGGLVFSILAYNVAKGTSFLHWDRAATRAMHAELNSIPWSLVEYILFGFFLGKEIVIGIAAILAVFFLYRRFWQELAMLLIGLGGGAWIWYFLNQYFDRPRPAGQLSVLSFTDPAFPSGLALAAVLCYGLLGYLTVPKLPFPILKWLVAMTLLFVIVFIGISTLLWGSHFVSDVIAGYALGVAWAGFVYTVMELCFGEETLRSRQSLSGGIFRQELRTPGWFRRWPVIGVALVLLGSLSFGAFGYNFLSNGPLLQLDISVHKQLIARAQSAPPILSELMTFGFFLGKQVVLVIVTLLCVYFIYKRFWRELAMLLLSSAAGSLVWGYFIDYFARPRPVEQTGLAVKALPSFPSGHTMSAIICYGFLAYLLIPRMPSAFWKWAVTITAVVIIMFIGFTRVFQGGHYLTDVAGGYALGLAWAGLVYLLIENISLKRKA